MHDSTQTPPVGGAAAVKVALLASKDLTKTERLVLVALAAHANVETGDSFPSVATLADLVGCSTRTIQRALAKLVALGRVVIRQVATIATRVYRLVRQTVTPGGDIQGPRGDNQSVGDDIQAVTRRGFEETKKNYKGRADALRRFLPGVKNNNPQQRQPYGYPERRGAALPPDRRTDRCPRHIGELANNCRCCRSEALAGGR
ncbi:helix-turn-helix domain-containing protein [Micromonospora ureilytica]|uniref:helix-turn-helix domain-containing protein n=1 Tax=Micromonospora ureilytica TaxID=709868 RepID=UPI002E10F8A6|nr:helix-turn-helix domain-containing protein [Micromonospora ureilytica]